MEAVPVGYEAFHSLRRRGVTLLCFLLTATMIMGIAVYVDSYSVHYWDEAVDVGEISLIVEGPDIDDVIDSIRQIDGIAKAVELQTEDAEVSFLYQGDVWYEWARACAPTTEYYDVFPNIYTISNGRLPQNESEIALARSFVSWEWVNLSIGSQLRYLSLGTNEERNMTVVGIYDVHGVDQDDWWNYYYFDFRAIVVPSVIDENSEMPVVHADVDRTRITPFNAVGSLTYLTGIAESIRSLDPEYTPQTPWSIYYPNSLLERGIHSYIQWQSNTRMSQLWRAVPAILLILMVGFLAIRHNVNERRYEANMLVARGASEGHVNSIINREIGIVAVISCGLGLLLGLGVSRIALGATGFFEFDFLLMIQEPWLITIESIILSLVTGILLPVLTLVGYRTVYSTKKTVEASSGRLYKVSRGLSLVKWDALIVVLASILMIAMYTGGSEVQSNPILGFLASITPLPLFIGMASLAVKGIRRGANLISRSLVRFVGEVPAFVGVRRIGKEASSAGPAIMVLVLAISLAWNSAVVDSTLPATNLNQARFAMGADIAFRLDTTQSGLWDEFLVNATDHALTSTVSRIDVTTLFLADEYDSRAFFAAIDPTEYSEIGYDHLGVRLNESELNVQLENLENDPSGVIISRDIADRYEFEEGDVLRAFEEWDSPQVYEFTIIGIVSAIPEVLERASKNGGGGPVFYYEDIRPPGPIDWERKFGERRAWIHHDLARVLFNETENVEHYCVLGTAAGANGTLVAEELLSSGGDDVIVSGEWGAVDFEVHHYVSQIMYEIDRAVDTMTTTVTLGVILGAFTIYAVEGVRARRREIALLRSMGASNSLVVRAQGAELLVLVFLSILLLGLYAPLFLANSLLTAVGTYGSWSYLFPVVVFPVIPWLLLLIVLTFFLASVVLFILAISTLATRVGLTTALNAAWAEAGPYGGDL